MFSLPSSYFVICVPSRRAGRSPSSYRGSRCEGLNCGACAAARAGRRKHPACHPVRWKPVSCSRAAYPVVERTRRPDPVGRHMGSNARERPRVNGAGALRPQSAANRWPSLRGGARRHLVSPGVGARVLSTCCDSSPMHNRRASGGEDTYCASPATTHTRSSSANPAYASHTYPSPSASNSSGTRKSGNPPPSVNDRGTM